MKRTITEEEALEYHSSNKKGKIAVEATKKMDNQRDLSLAYSPGVAYPCLEIAKDKTKAYDYTAKGNFVAVVTNGTAVLGLGDLGAQAAKPVMEGKAVLFKRFADIDAIDIEVDTKDIDEFVNCVKLLGASWGGINLEDIKAPDCFIIESKLREIMDIPVFHDDQHGTAIISLAALINAAYLTNREFKDLKIVVNGAGAAAIACIELIKAYGVKHENVILCDTKGVIYHGRTDGMNQWKSAHASNHQARTLVEAMVGADVFMGLSVKGAVTKEMVASMAKNPIIFAMANPDPEISPEEIREVRTDAIIATGRSDYNNQVNNVMGFPYIFRGALDVRASTINDEMKIAAAESIAALAREHVPDEVLLAYSGRKLQFGPEYIIPVPFDSRLLYTIAPAVAKAAMDTKVALKPIVNMADYVKELKCRFDPTANTMQLIFERVAKHPKRIIFAEGEEEQIIRTAVFWRDNGFGTPILVGRRHKIEAKIEKMMLNTTLDGIEICNAAVSEHVDEYIQHLYLKLQRKGYLYRDCARLVKNDRNIFASLMLAHAHGDALITGLVKGYQQSLEDVLKVIHQNDILFGYSLLLAKGKTVFISDTTVHELPSPTDLADIAAATARIARKMGHEPRVAFLSFSNFGNPYKEKAARVREAVKELDKRHVDFVYDGEMSADVALNPELLKLYPFSRLSDPANVLIMPALHTANVSSKLLQELGDGSVFGPILYGLEKPVQILQMNSSVSDILSLAAIAASDAIDIAESR